MYAYNNQNKKTSLRAYRGFVLWWNSVGWEKFPTTKNANFSHTFSHTSREKSEFLPNWANILHIHMSLSQVKDRERKWNWTKMYYHISGLADRFDGGNFLTTLVLESPA